MKLVISETVNDIPVVTEKENTILIADFDAGAGAVPLSTVTGKGSLIVATADGAVDELVVGTDGYVPVADSGEATGIKWIPTSGLVSSDVSGWTNPSQTWAYASSTTMTVPSGAASIYRVGDKWKLTANSVVLQGYIIAVADTQLTVVGDALTNHVFSDNYYSHSNPVGFPDYFNVVPSMAVANFDDGSGGQATVVKAFITIVGRRLHGRISASGTKAGTNTNLFIIAATQFGPILAANYSGVALIGIYSRAGVDFGTVSYVAATGNIVSTGASIADNTVIADASMDFSFEI